METDKKQHIIVLFLITLVACLTTKDALKAAIIAILIGFGKEVFDLFFGGVASMGDMAANFIGIFIGLILFITIQEITEKGAI